MQLFLYEHLNKLYRKKHANNNAMNGGPMTFDVALRKRVEELVEEKLKSMDVENGENLTPDEIADIHREADEEIRAKMKLNINTR